MICNKSECIKPNVRNFKYEPQKLSHVWSTILLILLFLPLTLAKGNEKQNTFSNSNLKNNFGIIILCVGIAIFYCQKCNGHIIPHRIHSIVFTVDKY